jgi:hypothetical protein
MDQLRKILSQISYKDNWRLSLSYDKNRNGAPYIQFTVDGACSVTGEATQWKSAKRYLSSFATEQEIVGSAFALARDAEEHETREMFRYKGRSIYNPHLNVTALAELASKKVNFDVRPDSMTNT